MKKRVESQEEFINQLKACELGLARGSVELVSHQSAWAHAYDLVISRIKPTLGNDLKIYEFHHIGSTSIVDLSAKPIIDVLLIFSDSEIFADNVPLLEQIGFTYKGDIIGRMNESEDAERHFFSFYDKDQINDYVHLHAFFKTHPDVAKLLKFRDRLRTDLDLKKDYENLKHNIKASGASRREYLELKKEFIISVIFQTQAKD